MTQRIWRKNSEKPLGSMIRRYRARLLSPHRPVRVCPQPMCGHLSLIYHWSILWDILMKFSVTSEILRPINFQCALQCETSIFSIYTSSILLFQALVKSNSRSSQPWSLDSCSKKTAAPWKKNCARLSACMTSRYTWLLSTTPVHCSP